MTESWNMKGEQDFTGDEEAGAGRAAQERDTRPPPPSLGRPEQGQGAGWDWRAMHEQGPARPEGPRPR